MMWLLAVHRGIAVEAGLVRAESAMETVGRPSEEGQRP